MFQPHAAQMILLEEMVLKSSGHHTWSLLERSNLWKLLYLEKIWVLQFATFHLPTLQEWGN